MTRRRGSTSADPLGSWSLARRVEPKNVADKGDPEDPDGVECAVVMCLQLQLTCCLSARCRGFVDAPGKAWKDKRHVLLRRLEEHSNA